LNSCGLYSLGNVDAQITDIEVQNNYDHNYDGEAEH
jgi:hypothetical protein